jgi:hypothetical protein
MMVTVPPGTKPGDNIAVGTDAGQVSVVIPEGKSPGDQIVITVPVNASQVAVTVANGSNGFLTESNGSAGGPKGSGLCCPRIQNRCPSFISTMTAFISSVFILMYTTRSVANLEPFLPQEVAGLFFGCIILTVLVAVLYKDPRFDGCCVHWGAVCATLKPEKRSTPGADING